MPYGLPSDDRPLGVVSEEAGAPSQGKLRALYAVEQAMMTLFEFLPEGSARELSDIKDRLRSLVLEDESEEREEPEMGFSLND